MSILDFLRTSKAFRAALSGAVFALFTFNFAAIFYITEGYAKLMPRSPDPEKGRIITLRPVKGTGIVYVNEHDLNVRDFVEYRLSPLCAITVIVFYGIGAWLGWWRSKPKKYTPPFLPPGKQPSPRQ